ncbi:GTPase [Candidatus Bathyarchaeota archaeon]|nr:GTPase [Candidatus Bathyarchaeota archaeon]
MVRKALIMGAAGRDFHNYNTHFRDNPDYEVVAFTAAQISELDATAGVEKRVYPPELAGPRYPNGIQIYPEGRLTALIKELDVDDVFFSYSDISAAYLHDKAAEVQAAGASFVLLGPKDTMIKPSKPLISVCAARTGSGKSPTSRWLVSLLRNNGHRVVVIRHPMPYGDLVKQRVQRFETYDDLDSHDCTIEEREDYEPHLDMGAVVYSGVDYADILKEAEKEAYVIIWDGGNNDYPFYVPDLHIVLVDPHRPGHELMYYPGETNVRMADIVIVSKVNTADPENVRKVKENVRRINPGAKIVDANIVITAEEEDSLSGKKVLVIEDGPTLTHGEMKYGAATLKAMERGADIVDPRPYVKGTIKEVFTLWPHLGKLLPAVGYSEHQIRELEEIINAVPCDLVLMGTPTDLRRYMKVDKPVLRVRYEFEEIEPGSLGIEALKVIE